MTTGYIHVGRPFLGDDAGTARCLASPEPLARTMLVATCVDLDAGDHYDEGFWEAVGDVLVAQGIANSPDPENVR